MNQDTHPSLAIEELEQRLEMSAVPVLATEDGEDVKKCSTSTVIEF